MNFSNIITPNLDEYNILYNSTLLIYNLQYSFVLFSYLKMKKLTQISGMLQKRSFHDNYVTDSIY